MVLEKCCPEVQILNLFIVSVLRHLTLHSRPEIPLSYNRRTVKTMLVVKAVRKKAKTDVTNNLEVITAENLTVPLTGHQTW